MKSGPTTKPEINMAPSKYFDSNGTMISYSRRQPGAGLENLKYPKFVFKNFLSY